MNKKVTVTIKVPSQTIKLNLDVPEMEIDDVVNAICAQVEDYENRDEDDEDENYDGTFEVDEDEIEYEE
jgi:hypothetical protein